MRSTHVGRIYTASAIVSQLWRYRYSVSQEAIVRQGHTFLILALSNILGTKIHSCWFAHKNTSSKYLLFTFCMFYTLIAFNTS